MSRTEGLVSDEVSTDYQQDPSVDMSGYMDLHDRMPGERSKGNRPGSERASQDPQNARDGCLFPSSLDSKLRNLPRRDPWSSKQKRAYHRLLSGFRRARVMGEPIRFLTLTSAPNSPSARINANFQVLRKRIRRRFGQIKYWKLRTNEGHGVLHILFRGRFLPQCWISRNWRQIHGAKICDIRLFRGGIKKIANYLVANYLCQQSFERMSWSWSWVFKRFVLVWHRDFLNKCGSIRVAVAKWNAYLAHLNLNSGVPWIQGKVI